MHSRVYRTVLQYDKYKWVLSLCGFTLDSANTDVVLHVPLGIFGRKNFRCYPSIVNRVGRLEIVIHRTQHSRRLPACTSWFAERYFAVHGFLVNLLPSITLLFFLFVFCHKINHSSWKKKISFPVVHVNLHWNHLYHQKLLLVDEGDHDLPNQVKFVPLWNIII